MVRVSLCVVFAVLLSACAAPIQTLPGRVVDASIVLEDGDLKLIDWIGAGEIARVDGYPVQRIPQSSPKPSPEEIAQANAMLERNRAYTEYVQRPETLRRAQEKVRPELERWLLETPKSPFFASGRSYPALNARSGQNLKIILKPRGAIVSPRSVAQMDSAQATASVLAAGLASGRRTLMRFVGEYQLVFADTGNVLKAGTIRPKFTSDGPPTFSDPYQHVFAMMIWDAIARDGGTTPVAPTTKSTATKKPVVQRSPDPAPTAPVAPIADAAKSEPVPGSPPLVEGTSYALFTPAQIAAYCQQNWHTRTAQDGRTEYNPCTERAAFAP